MDEKIKELVTAINEFKKKYEEENDCELSMKMMPVSGADVAEKTARCLSDLEMYCHIIINMKIENEEAPSGFSNVIVHFLALLKAIVRRAFEREDRNPKEIEAIIAAINLTGKHLGVDVPNEVKENKESFKERGTLITF